MDKIGRKQRLYRERVLANVCTYCGKEPPNSSSKQCEQCRLKMRSYHDKVKDSLSQKQLKEYRKANKLCVYCGVAIDGDHFSCEKCRKYHNTASNKARLKRINNKLCARCGADVRYETYKICQNCRRKELAQKAKAYLEHGLCRTCGRHPIRRPECTICEPCNIRLRAQKRKRNLQTRQTILDHYGNKCACCGESTPEFLTLDHINNDGAAHKRAIGRDSIAIYRWVVKNNFPDTFQLLCYNCNCAKGRYGICPHQKQRNTVATATTW